MQTYTSVTGYKVKVEPGEEIIKYDRELIENLFCDPITHEWYVEPIVMNGHLYDKKKLQQWLRKSSKDPLTGEDLSELGESTVYPCNIIKYIMFCFEEPNEGDETIKFHACPNDIIYAHEIGAKLPFKMDEENVQTLSVYDNIRDTRHNYLGISKDGIFRDRKIFASNLKSVKGLKNCELFNCVNIPDHIVDCKVESNIRNYTLEDYLFTDIISGVKLIPKETHVTKDGFLVSSEHVGKTINGFTCGTKDGLLFYLGLQDTKPFKYVFEQFRDVLGHDNFEPTFKPNFKCSYYVYQHAPLQDVEDRTIQVRSQGEMIWNRLEEIVELVRKDRSLCDAIEKVSSMVNNHTVKPNYGGRITEIEQFRKDQGVPFVTSPEENMYGMDLSLLNLSKKNFSGHDFKDYLFSGSDLTDTVFSKCRFNECCFVGARMEGTRFIDCEIGYPRPFYKTSIDRNTVFNITLTNESELSIKYLKDLFTENGLRPLKFTNKY